MKFTKKSSSGEFNGSSLRSSKELGRYPEQFTKGNFWYYLFQHEKDHAIYIKYIKSKGIDIVGFIVVHPDNSVKKFPTAGNYGGVYKRMDDYFNKVAFGVRLNKY